MTNWVTGQSSRRPPGVCTSKVKEKKEGQHGLFAGLGKGSGDDPSMKESRDRTAKLYKKNVRVYICPF